jgi:glutamate-5-semialdehyde dehydrogenase
MNTVLPIEKEVLNQMAVKERTAIQAENQQDLANYSGGDLAMEKRLLVDDAKIDGMILS